MPDPGQADPPAGSTERELVRSEEQFRLLVESVVDYAIFVLDREGFIRSWNPGAEWLKGYTEDEIIGQHYSIFYPEELLQQDLPTKLLARAREEGHTEHEGWRVRKDGTRFWALVVITALREEDGSLVGFAKVTRDMTEAHEARREREEALERKEQTLRRLRELDKWRREFVSAVTHDLRSPVASILGFVRVLRDESVSDEEAELFLERIQVNAESIDALLEHLRTHAQLESGQITVELEPLELAPVVRSVISAMAPVIADHEVDVLTDGIQVMADRRGLERILRNLLSNAARHTPAGGAISVRAERNGQYATIEVEDEGDGIPPERLGRIFERFERGATGGSGLGLAIVKQYVELHEGEVSATSTPGEGTIVRFTLPFAG